MSNFSLFSPGNGHGRAPGVDGIQQVRVKSACVLNDAVKMVQKLLVSSVKSDFAHNVSISICLQKMVRFMFRRCLYRTRTPWQPDFFLGGRVVVNVCELKCPCRSACLDRYIKVMDGCSSLFLCMN